MNKFLPIFLQIISPFIFLHLHSQESNSPNSNNWKVSAEKPKAFIENKGQFDNSIASHVRFAMDEGNTIIYFSPGGLTYHFRKTEIPKDEQEERESGLKGKKKMTPEEWMEFERKERNGKVETDFINMQWENSNPDAKIISEDLAEGYQSYSFYDGKKVKNHNHLKGYKKLIYKNLYPNIDAEYIFHAQSGIKYSLILHPGADVSKVKMNYSGSKKVFIDKKGEIHISTKFGDIIDHAPESFFANNKDKISSSFSLKNNMVSFVLNLPTSYSQSTTIIIDPWTQTPTIPASNTVLECEKDGGGNVYILGGENPMRLIKYNSAGVYQWTHSTPYDTANFWLGTIATDLAGNSYISAGSNAQLEKVDASGGLLWTWASGPNSIVEYWSITLSCDQTKLIVGGTSGTSSPTLDIKGAIYEINSSNGIVSDSIIVGAMFNTFPNTYINEVRSIAPGQNGKYYYLTLDTIGAINKNFSGCSYNESIFTTNHGYKLAYKCENYRPQNGNGGISAIRANKNFLYTHSGDTLDKRDLLNGAIITRVEIPGGISINNNGRNQVGNSGIDIDSCGNVYVGSGNAVIKYDPNLNLLVSVPTSFKVYDVAVSYNGEVVVAGATGDNTVINRTGYVQSINMSACGPIIYSCCEPAICPTGNFCSTDSAVNFSAASPGGIWTGPGITNSVSGTFNPSVSGPGTFNISYSLGCGNDIISVKVNDCAELSVCKDVNGNLTVTNGTAPYIWEKDSSYLDCSACFSGSCTFPAGCAVNVSNWIQIGSNATISFPDSFPIRVTDINGNILVIDSLTQIPTCNVCSLNFSISSTPDSGNNEGAAFAYVLSGNPPFAYQWSPNANNQTTSTATGLSSGVYYVTVTDSANCSKVDSVQISLFECTLSFSLSSLPDSGNNTGAAKVNIINGYPPYNFSWSPNTNNQSTVTASGLSAGTYYVTVSDSANCSVVDSVEVTFTVGGTASIPHFASSFLIYPNPAKNEIKVLLNKENISSLKVKIINALGKEILKFERNPVAGKKEIPIDISKLSPGVYFISVVSNNGNPVKVKFIKE